MADSVQLLQHVADSSVHFVHVCIMYLFQDLLYISSSAYTATMPLLQETMLMAADCPSYNTQPYNLLNIILSLCMSGSVLAAAV